MLLLNIKHAKRCAFCKHWHDPTDSAIAPKSPSIGLWEIRNANQKRMCLKKNTLMVANAFCSHHYECKI